MRALFPTLALVMVFLHMLPLDTIPRGWAPPDLILALALAWSLRRPDYLPALILAGTMLFADMLFQRPPGLFALLVVLGCEFLKSRVLPHRETTFMGEWFAVTLVISAIALFNRLVLFLLGVDQAPLSLTMIQMFMTIAAYPPVAFFTQGVLGVRKLTPAEAEALGKH